MQPKPSACQTHPKGQTEAVQKNSNVTKWPTPDKDTALREPTFLFFFFSFLFFMGTSFFCRVFLRGNKQAKKQQTVKSVVVLLLLFFVLLFLHLRREGSLVSRTATPTPTPTPAASSGGQMLDTGTDSEKERERAKMKTQNENEIEGFHNQENPQTNTMNAEKERLSWWRFFWRRHRINDMDAERGEGWHAPCSAPASSRPPQPLSLYRDSI